MGSVENFKEGSAMDIDFSDENKEPLIAKLTVLLEMKEAKDHTEKIFNEIKVQFQALQEEIYIMMEDAGVTSIALDGRNCHRKLDRYFSLKDKEKGFEWLRANGLGYLILPNVNAQSLSSAMKTFQEEKGEIDTDIVGEKQVQRIGIRKK